MQIKKIITHAGVFHADEVLAIATLRIFGVDVPIERKFQITQEEIDDPEIWILDIGMVQDFEKHNFDHHHPTQKNSPATNLLVLNYLEQVGWVDSNLAKMLRERLYEYVSDCDRGIIINPKQDYTFSSMVRSFNVLSVEGFENALNFTLDYLRVLVDCYRKEINDKKRWDILEKIEDNGFYLAIQEDTNIIFGWKEYAVADNVYMLVSPNERGGWQIISRDSEIIKIPKHLNQTFLHNSGFIAVYDTKENAVQHAKNILFDFIESQK